MSKGYLKIKKWAQTAGPARFFVVAGLIFGSIFILLTPPFEGADEPVHYLRAYQISQGQLMEQKVGDRFGGYLPDSIIRTLDYTTRSPDVPYHPKTMYPIGKTHKALSFPLQPQKKSFYEFGPAASYAPVPYLPASLGILVARLLHLSPVVTLYAARFGNLLAWLALVGAAVALMPRKKWAFAFLGLLPMALFQASVVNADSVAIGSTVLLLAYIFRLRERPGILTSRQWLWLLLLASVMVLSKQIMFVLLPLALLLGRGFFKNHRDYWLRMSGLLILPLILTGLWLLVIHNHDTSQAINSQPQPQKQLSWIIHHPYDYGRLIYDTYFYTSGDHIMTSFIGNFGWFDTPLSVLVAAFGYIMLAVSLIGNSEKRTRSRPLTAVDKWLIGGLIAIFFLAVNTSLYVFYSPLNWPTIYGVQGRYLLPLAFLAVPFFYRSSFSIDRARYERLVARGSLVLLISSAITIFVRYY